MYHWQDPRQRGVYSHPAALPPRPANPYANDLSARLARVEEHLHFGALDRHRIEEESRLRARDLAETTESLHDQIVHLGDRLENKIDGLGSRLVIMEQERHTRRTLWAAAGTLAGSAKDFLRYALIVLLGLLIATGNATVERLKPLFGLLSGGNG